VVAVGLPLGLLSLRVVIILSLVILVLILVDGLKIGELFSAVVLKLVRQLIKRRRVAEVAKGHLLVQIDAFEPRAQNLVQRLDILLVLLLLFFELREEAFWGGPGGEWSGVTFSW
jgi:hypothetical protein